jgi:hypothetical protein
MGFEGIHHLPIVDGSGKLLGLLSSLDLLEWYARVFGYRKGALGRDRAFERPAWRPSAQDEP